MCPVGGGAGRKEDENPESRMAPLVTSWGILLKAHQTPNMARGESRMQQSRLGNKREIRRERHKVEMTSSFAGNRLMMCKTCYEWNEGLGEGKKEDKIRFHGY